MPQLLAVLALVSGAHAASSQSLPWRYGAFIDGGSEGSRIYVMRWKPSLDPEGEIICPEIIGDKSTAPGVASFALNHTGAGASLEPLVEYTKKLMHSERGQWAHMPLYLRATAGMRLLFPEQRESILDNIRTYFRTLPFLFRDDMASVATGEEEGVFGWISANYLMGNLRPDKVPNASSTIGSLDLGGASAQIVFIPQKSIIQHAFPLRLGPHQLQVYSYSFLRFGIREAAHHAAMLVISDALMSVQSENSIKHPCFSKGYVYIPKFSYSDQSFAPIQVSMKGTSDFEGCEALVKRIFDKNAPCLIEQCSFYGVYQPRVLDVKFLAFSHFADIAGDLGVPEKGRLEDLLVAARYVCSLSRAQLDLLFKRVQDETIRMHLCFHATFAVTLLHSGYGIEENDILFKSNHNGQPIDWAVGAMMYAINQDNKLSRPLVNVSTAHVLDV